MQTEIEAKFLNVDHVVIRERLKELGAICEQPMRLMRRYNFDFPDQRLSKEKNGWVRVRDEGGKITVSYKQLNDRTLHGTKEVCVTVDNFDQAKAFLESIGLEAHSYQETRRESWKLGSAEIELDEWPWAKPYLEIEAGSEADIRDVAGRLGVAWEQAVHGSVEVVYQAEYDVTDEMFDYIPTIRFEDPVAEILEKHRRKN